MPVLVDPLAGDSYRLRQLVVALAITQTVGYGVLYYAFSAMLGPMSRDLGLTTATVTGAMTTSLLVGAGLSVPVGRWLDAHGGHRLMTAGSLLAVIAVLLWSQARNAVQLYGAFVAIGVASAMVLYPAAFAVVVAVAAPAKRTGAILGITLMAGFASSIFIPLTGRLTADRGWRATVLILGGILAVTTVPLHASAVRRTARRPGATAVHRAWPRRALRDPGFWFLAGGFVLHHAALGVIAVHLVLYLTVLGHPPAIASTLAGLLGVLSVTGRIASTISVRWLPMATITAVVLSMQGVAIAMLPLIGTHLGGVVVCLVLFGLGFGVSAIATPAIVLDRYGAKGYATIAGILSTPVAIAEAVAPLAGAILAGSAGYRALVLSVGGVSLAAAASLVLAQRIPAPGVPGAG